MTKEEARRQNVLELGPGVRVRSAWDRSAPARSAWARHAKRFAIILLVSLVVGSVVTFTWWWNQPHARWGYELTAMVETPAGPVRPSQRYGAVSEYYAAPAFNTKNRSGWRTHSKVYGPSLDLTAALGIAPPAMLVAVPPEGDEAKWPAHVFWPELASRLDLPAIPHRPQPHGRLVHGMVNPSGYHEVMRALAELSDLPAKVVPPSTRPRFVYFTDRRDERTAHLVDIERANELAAPGHWLLGFKMKVHPDGPREVDETDYLIANRKRQRWSHVLKSLRAAGRRDVIDALIYASTGKD